MSGSLDVWIRMMIPRALAYERALLRDLGAADDVVQDCYASLLKHAVPGEIDLAGFRGREVSIAFIVDPLTEPAGDWATWVAPRVVLR